MNALVTGGAGFIGSHLSALLLARGHRVRILDSFRTGNPANLANLDVELIQGSICDRHAVRRAVQGIDWVFHLAAMVSVTESVENPLNCLEHNEKGLLIVLEESVAADVRRLCYSSSSAVYGENPAPLKHEDLLPDPRSPYAVAKLAGEYHCRLCTLAGGLETVSLRYFNVFGPRQDPDGPYAAAVPAFIREALAGRPLTIHGDGRQTRDFISVRDVAAANLFAAEQPGLTGTFNVGRGDELTILDLAERIIAATGSCSAIRHEAARAGDVRHSRADIGRLRAAGFAPTNDLDAALAETISHFRNY